MHTRVALTYWSLEIDMCINEMGQHWLVQIMACRLLGTKPLTEQMLIHFQLVHMDKFQ